MKLEVSGLGSSQAVKQQQQQKGRMNGLIVEQTICLHTKKYSSLSPVDW